MKPRQSSGVKRHKKWVFITQIRYEHSICVATQKLIETKTESQPLWLGVVFLLLWGVRSKEWGALLWKWGACSEFWGVELKKRHGREEKSRFSIWSCAFYSFPAGHFFAADKKGLIEKMQFFVIAKYRYEKNITGNKAFFARGTWKIAIFMV